jgi:hypothetical protein
VFTEFVLFIGSVFDFAGPFHFDIQPEIPAPCCGQANIENARSDAFRFQVSTAYFRSLFRFAASATIRDMVKPTQFGPLCAMQSSPTKNGPLLAGFRL